MSFDDSTYYKIEAYLNGELSSEEHNLFEKELSVNTELSQAVEKHKLANALIVEQRLLSVKEILREQQIKSTGNSNYTLLTVAALVLISSAVAVFTYRNTADENKTAISDTAAQQSNTASSSITEKTQSGINNSAQTITGTGLHKQEIQAYEQAMTEGYNSTEEKSIVSSAIDSVKTSVKTENKIIENIPQKQTVVKDICADVVIKAQIKATAACRNESSGEILVYAIQGGTKPYVVELKNTEMESVVSGELAAGKYQAIITDANSCIQKYPAIQIAEKECSVDYSFNPFIGEKWQIDAYSSNGHLQLYNKGGVPYYQDNVPANEVFEWSGTGSSNQILPGYYIFAIKYADGTVKRGSVTIVQ